MKKVILFMLVFWSIAFISGCGTFYEVLNEGENSGALKQYAGKKIHVGWLPLKESQWEKLRYASKKDWHDIIYNDMNLLQRKKAFKNNLSTKSITFSDSESDKFPADSDLYIKFSDATITQEGGGHRGGQFIIYITVHFIDSKTKKEIFKSSIKAGDAPGGWTQEQRFASCVRNIAKYVSEKF